MKKMMLVLACFCCCFGGFSLRAEEEINWGERLMLYLPNRILDAFDLFSINLGVGPVIEGRLMGTRFCDVGGGMEFKTFKLYKNFNRRYGFGTEEGWYWSLVFAGEEDYSLLDGAGLVDTYVETRSGVPDPARRVYDFFEGKRDYWAIGGALGFGVDAEIYTHPVEWIDFVLGFVFIDIKHDDLKMDDFR